jgi:chromatin assembly factor 1 subunit A
MTTPKTPKTGVKRKMSMREKEELSEKKRQATEAKKLELEAKKKKLEEEKQEKKRKLDEEKQARDEKKRQLELEKEDEKEDEKKKQQEKEKLEKDAEKEKQRLEKEALKAKKQQELDAKAEEKRKKDEEKRLVEEDKLRKLEEKRLKDEEEKRKQQKTSKMFLSFFKTPASGDASTSVDAENPSRSNSQETKANTLAFLPFQLKQDQTLHHFVKDFAKERFVMGAFDSAVKDQDSTVLFLEHLKQGYTPVKNRRRGNKMVDDEVIVLEEKDSTKVTKKVKFLLFDEDIRPPYYGTWSKKSKIISGRCPLKQDTKWLDYDCDSEADWEEEGPGESIKDSDSEKSQGEDNYEVDDDMFVPHGYLSEDEDQEKADGDVQGSMLKESELIETRNRKLKPMKARVIGCVWENDPDASEASLHILKQFKATYNLAVIKDLQKLK